jgi:hypothetical protein
MKLFLIPTFLFFCLFAVSANGQNNGVQIKTPGAGINFSWKRVSSGHKIPLQYPSTSTIKNEHSSKGTIRKPGHSIPLGDSPSNLIPIRTKSNSNIVIDIGHGKIRVSPAAKKDLNN